MKCALIGTGMVAGTHVAALNASPHVTLHGVMGRDPKKTWAFAGETGVVAYDDLNILAHDPALDFVIVATPPDARAEITETLARAGKPILMEKPIERSAQAARHIVHSCADAQVPLGIVFQHRARAASRALKDQIDGGALGQIASIDIRVPWWRDQSYYEGAGRGTYARDGGGVMITQAIHSLDLALWLCGPVACVQALMRTSPLHALEAEDWAGGLFQFQSGAVGSLMATTASFPGAAESLTIQGTKAAAHLENGVLKIRHLDGRSSDIGEMASGTGGGADPMAFTHAWHQSVIEDFADAVRNNRAPLAPGADALHVHDVISAMERASTTGQKVEIT